MQEFDQKKVISEVFNLTGHKISEDDPLIIAFIYMSYIHQQQLKHSNDDFLETLKAVANEIDTSVNNVLKSQINTNNSIMEFSLERKAVVSELLAINKKQLLQDFINHIENNLPEKKPVFDKKLAVIIITSNFFMILLTALIFKFL